MCCDLFHVLAIHLCEYVLTTLPRTISKVLNVFFVVLVFARIQRYMWIFAEKKCRVNISMKSHSFTIPNVGNPPISCKK
jgi:hypothetical protein